MTVPNHSWIKELPAEIMVCGTDGLILQMNNVAELIFAANGGHDLLGSNVLDCHPEPSRAKLEGMMTKQLSNTYFNTENGEKRFFYQAPWYKSGQYAGFVEISFEIPEDLPHFLRG